MRRLVFALGALGCVFASTDAGACGNEVNLNPLSDTSTATLAMAEQALDRGDFVTARAKLARAREKLIGQPGPILVSLAPRADRIEAMIDVRDKRDAQSGRRAVALLRAQLAEAPRPELSSPALRGDLGESAESVPELQGEAAKTLEELAEKDLLGSAWTYAALTRLRARAGDVAGSTAAKARCELMASAPQICRGEPVPSKKARMWLAFVPVSAVFALIAFVIGLRRIARASRMRKALEA